MIEQTEILTPWGIDSDDGANIPQVVLDYLYDGDGRAIPNTAYQDTTGQQNVQPDPNVTLATIVAPTAIIDAIDADADYSVVWREEL